jgi:hypothetical protein
MEGAHHVHIEDALRAEIVCLALEILASAT